MALSTCSGAAGPQGKEEARHGTPGFPIASYEDDVFRSAVPWHWQEEWEWILVTRGSLEICLENTRLPLRQGESIFLNSGVLHSVQPSPGGPSVLHSVVFHPRLIGGSLDSVFWQKLVQPFQQPTAPRFILLGPASGWQQESIHCLQEAWDVLAAEDEDFENRVRYQLSRGLGLLRRHFPVKAQQPFTQEQTAAQRVKTMLRFLQEHFSEEVTLEQIAASASVSESSCLRCFRQVLGTTPIQYLRHFRIEKAAELLLTTNQTAGEVGMACGFSDISYFTRIFRELKGCTPGDFRRQAHYSPKAFSPSLTS